MRYVVGYKDKVTEQFVCEIFESYHAAHRRYVELDILGKMIYKVIGEQ